MKEIIGSFWNVDMVQYGKYQLEGLQDQRICVRSSKRDKKAFKYYIRKKKSDDLDTS